MDSSGIGLNYMPGGVIRWEDTDRSQEPVVVQLRRRPGVWALIGRNVTAAGLSGPSAPWAPLTELDDIEVEHRPVDDGDYGVLYDVYARCVQGPECASSTGARAAR